MPVNREVTVAGRKWSGSRSLKARVLRVEGADVAPVQDEGSSVPEAHRRIQDQRIDRIHVGIPVNEPMPGADSGGSFGVLGRRFGDGINNPSMRKTRRPESTGAIAAVDVYRSPAADDGKTSARRRDLLSPSGNSIIVRVADNLHTGANGGRKADQFQGVMVPGKGADLTATTSVAQFS